MLALTLLFACGTTDPGQAQTVPTVEDLDAALERIEALEQQVAALQAAVGVAPVEDADHDGYRDSDGLPVGTRRGDVLWEGRCEGSDADDFVTYPAWAVSEPVAEGEIPAPSPVWLWWCGDDRGCSIVQGDFEPISNERQGCNGPGRYVIVAR